MIIGEPPAPSGAFGVDAIAVTMRFGDFLALDNVELKEIGRASWREML